MCPFVAQLLFESHNALVHTVFANITSVGRRWLKAVASMPAPPIEDVADLDLDEVKSISKTGGACSWSLFISVASVR